MGIDAELCELALDGLRFRIWIEGASHGGDIIRLAKLLTDCVQPEHYRAAIDRFIIEKAKP